MATTKVFSSMDDGSYKVVTKGGDVTKVTIINGQPHILDYQSEDMNDPQQRDHKYQRNLKRQRDQRKKQKKNGKNLAKHTPREFARNFDLTNHIDAQLYLEALDTWTRTTRFPARYASYVDFAEGYIRDIPHRKAALLVLATAKNPHARRLLRAATGKLTEEEFNQPIVEAQSMEVLWFTLVATFLAFLAYQARTAVKMLQGETQKVTNPIAAITGPIGSVISSVSDVVKNVWTWVKEQWRKLKEQMEKVPEMAWLVAKIILSTVLFFMGVKYAASYFPSFVEPVKRFLMMKMGIEDQVELQADEEEQEEEQPNVLRSIFGFINKHFLHVPKGDFWSLLGTLPKFVSVATALCWILDKFETVYGWMLEAITGRPRGRNKLEKDILTVGSEIDKLDIQQLTATSVESASTAIDLEVSRLKVEMESITRRMMAGTKPYRPIFSTLVSSMKQALHKIEQKLRIEQMAAKPRAVPVWVYLYGAPGVGKSYVTETLMKSVWRYVQAYSDIFGKDMFSPGQIYAYPEGEEYWDGYSGQPFVLIDDLFQRKDPQIRSTTAGTLINLISPTPYTLRTADPMKKNRVHFTSRCILSTTNVLETNKLKGENVGLASVEALQTRRSIVAEMIKEGNERYFIVQGKINGEENTKISVPEMVALIGECIIQRETEKLNPPEHVVPNRFKGTYQAPRILVMTDEEEGENDVVLQGKTKEEEEKEKEHEENFEDFRIVPRKTMQEMRTELKGKARRLQEEEETLRLRRVQAAARYRVEKQKKKKKKTRPPKKRRI